MRWSTAIGLMGTVFASPSSSSSSSIMASAVRNGVPGKGGHGMVMRNASGRARQPAAIALSSSPSSSSGFVGDSSGSGSSRKREREGEPLQHIYDTLLSITDYTRAAAQPNSNIKISEIMEAMSKVQLSDLGLTEMQLKRIKDNVCMNVISTNDFHLSVFIMPQGKGLPLHDHPGMTVISKLVAGSLNIRSFSPAESTTSNTVAFSSKPSAKVKAQMTQKSVRTFNDGAWLLTPYRDNVHEFFNDNDASTPAVVLDVLLPPYMEPERPCNYYRAVKDKISQSSDSSIGDWWLESAPDPADATLPYNIRYNGFKPIQRSTR